MIKKIGVAGWIRDGFFGISTQYAAFISRFGKVVVLGPQDEDDLPEVDLVVLPGGADVSPFTYGESTQFKTGNSNAMLENFDNRILPKYLELNTPIFAICRGAQRLWTLYGGELIQDYPYHSQSLPPNEQVHELQFTPSFVHLSKMITGVTSRHHQAMNASNFVPDELQVIAVAREKIGTKWINDEKVVEIFRHKTKPIYGVQYHPEDHYPPSDFYTPHIINSLLGAK